MPVTAPGVTGRGPPGPGWPRWGPGRDTHLGQPWTVASLATTDTTLDAVARQVGYSSAFAFSAAFKRARGVSPSSFRRASAGVG